MTTGLTDLLGRIEKLEKDIRKKHPKSSGRLLIQNIKSCVDYSFKGDINEMEWASRYLEKLEGNL